VSEFSQRIDHLGWAHRAKEIGLALQEILGHLNLLYSSQRVIVYAVHTRPFDFQSVVVCAATHGLEFVFQMRID
jgi:hypothetical protein